MRTREHRNWKSAWLTGVVLTALASLATADDAADRESKRLEGTWTFVSLRAGDTEAPADVVEKWRCVIRGKELTWVVTGRGEQKNSFEIDPSKSPKAIDITPLDEAAKGKKLQGIYKFEEGRLVICLPAPPAAGKPRPEGFESGEDRGLYVLERIENK